MTQVVWTGLVCTHRKQQVIDQIWQLVVQDLMYDAITQLFYDAEWIT